MATSVQDFRVKNGLLVTTTATIESSLNSSSTTTGALRVVGGAGIGGNLYVGGEIVATKLTIELTTVTTTLVTTDDVIKTTNSTNATSTNTGALQIAGGAGIGRDLYVGGTIFGNISGGGTTIQTVQQTTNATHFLTFVDSNNASATAEAIYTTASILVNPGNSSVGFNATPFTTSTTSRIYLGGDFTFVGANRSLLGNLYYDTNWKYAGNGYGWGFREDGAGKVQMLRAANNTSGASAAATVTSIDLFTFDLVNNYAGLGQGTPTTKLDVTGGLRVSGITTVTNITSATSTITGALQVAGGAGIGQDLYVGGSLYVNGLSFRPLNIQEFTATASQTTFTITNGYTVGTVQVFANGIQLDNSAFTAANGSTVVLGTARLSGDIIKVVSGGVITTTIINTATNAAVAYSLANTSTTYVGRAVLADSATTATNAATAYKTIGVHSAGTGLTGTNFDGSANQTWTLNTATLVANAITANNISGGSAGQVPYQTAAGSTSFFGPGTTGQLLVSGGAAIPVYTNTSSIHVATANYAQNANTLDSLDSTSFLRSDSATTWNGTASGPFTVLTPNTSLGTITGQVNTLQILQQTLNTDAFMTFHISGDYAVHFGLDGTTNDLFVGGWSAGAVKNKIVHAGNTSTAHVATANYAASAGSVSGGSSSAATVATIQRTTSADHFLTFVDSHNLTSANELIYTTSTLVVNPSTGNVGIATAAPTTRLDITGGLRVSGITTVTNVTAATSTTTGALQVAGGVGIGGNLYVGGEIVAQRLTIQLTTITTTLVQTDDVIQTLNVTNATSTITGALQVAGGAGIGRNLYVGGIVNSPVLSVNNIYESLSSLSGATGVVTHNVATSNIFNHTSIAANFTVNLTNLNLSAGFATNVVLVLNQGATAYIPSAVQIAGVAQTINWQGGSAPTGSANKKDIVSFSITNIGGTYAVFGQLVSFG